MTATPELTYEAHRAAMSNTDDADTRTVLLAILSCAQAWEGSVRILGNVRASDAVRALSAALSVPAEAVVGEPVGYVSTPELVQLKMGVSCVDLFREPQPGGIDFAPVYGRPQPGKPWRVFEDITHGWWGIEVDGDNDADPILYPIKINRESLEKIVKHFNEALGGKP